MRKKFPLINTVLISLVKSKSDKMLILWQSAQLGVPRQEQLRAYWFIILERRKYRTTDNQTNNGTNGTHADYTAGPATTTTSPHPCKFLYAFAIAGRLSHTETSYRTETFLLIWKFLFIKCLTKRLIYDSFNLCWILSYLRQDLYMKFLRYKVLGTYVKFHFDMMSQYWVLYY